MRHVGCCDIVRRAVRASCNTEPKVCNRIAATLDECLLGYTSYHFMVTCVKLLHAAPDHTLICQQRICQSSFLAWQGTYVRKFLFVLLLVLTAVEIIGFNLWVNLVTLVCY